MQKKNLTRNYIYNLTYQILVLLIPLITTPYLSRILGSEGIGIYSYTLSISTYFILFGSLGISMYCQREIAYVQDDIKKRSKIFWELIILRCITIFIACILFYFIFCTHIQYSLYYKILLINLIATCFDVSPFFQGMEEFKKVIFRNVIVKLISVVSVFLFVKNSTHVWIYLFIYVLSILIGNISLWFYLPKYIVKPDFKILTLKKHLKPMLLLFIPQVAVEIYTVLDKTMIGAMVIDKSEVGYYEQSQKIIKLILTVITSLGTVMLPRVANQFANGKKDEIKENIMKSINFVYFLAIPMMFGMIAVSDRFIPLFLGQGFDKAIVISKVISPILIFIGLSNAIGIQYLLPIKKQKQYTISVIIGATTNLIFNYLFIRYYASIGAAIATVIAEFVVTIVQMFFVRKEFNLFTIIGLCKKYLISSIFMFVVVFFVGKFMEFNDIFVLFIQVGLGIFTYILILYCLKDSFINNITNKVKCKLNKGK